MKCFLAIVVSCVALFSCSSGEPPCHMQEVFSCLDISIAHINSYPRKTLPKTEEEINNCCTAANHTGHCLVDYSKRCMTPIQREIVSLVTEGMGDMYKQLCVDSPSQIRADYLAHAECLNKVMQDDQTGKNINYLLAVFETFLSLPDTKRIQYICCGYNKMYNAFRTDIVSTCSEEAAQTLEKLIQLGIAQLPEVVCTGIDGDGAECTAILPPPGAKPTEGLKENPIYKFIYSIFKNYMD